MLDVSISDFFSMLSRIKAAAGLLYSINPVAHPSAPRRPKRPFPGHRYRSIAISRNSPSRQIVDSYGAGS